MKTVLTLTAATALALSACVKPGICDRDHPLYERGSCVSGDGSDGISVPDAKPDPKPKKPKKDPTKDKKDPAKEPKPDTERPGEGDNPGDNPGDGDNPNTGGDNPGEGDNPGGEGTGGCGKRHCDPVPGDTTGEDILDDDDVIIGDDGFPRRRPNNGFGNGGSDGVPGRSPHGDEGR